MIKSLLTSNLNPKLKVTVEPKILKKIDLLAEKTEGFSGRDIEALFTSVIQKTSHKHTKTRKTRLSYDTLEQEMIERNEQKQREEEELRRKVVLAH